MRVNLVVVGDPRRQLTHHGLGIRFREWAKLGPLIGLDPNQLLLLQGAENRSPVTVNGSEPEAISSLRRRLPSMGVSSA